MKLNKLERAILYLLSRAKENGVKNLSSFQIMKILYMLEVESRRFIGRSFIGENEIRFFRYPRGPISYDIYNSLSTLENGFIKVEESQTSGYPNPRRCYSLKKSINPLKLGFTKEELLFMNSVIDDYVNTNQKKLGEIVYSTEPMKSITKKEKNNQILEGIPLQMNEVYLDKDIVAMIN